MLKVTLVRPKSPYNRTVFHRAAMPPLNLMLLAALARNLAHVRIVDEIVEDLVIDRDTDLVGVTVPTTAYVRRAYEVAEHCRGRGIAVVMGGMHPSFFPDEALHHCDAVVCGDGEDAWPRLLKDFSAGTLAKRYSAEPRKPLIGLPTPRWDLVRRDRYFVNYPIQATRGCARSCAYCSVSAFHSSHHRTRPVEEVVEEIRSTGARVVPIVDDNLFANREYAKELMAALIPLRVRWGSQVPIDRFRDPEILDLAVRSGCSWVFMGFESVSREALREVRRSRQRDDVTARTLSELSAAGIRAVGHFIFGFDNDAPDVFSSTCEYAQRLPLPYVQFHILTPYPGTALHERLRSEGRIFDYDWSRYDARHVVFRPAQMTPSQLYEGFVQAFRTFYGVRKTYRRLRACGQLDLRGVGLSLGFNRVVAKHMARGGA